MRNTTNRNINKISRQAPSSTKYFSKVLSILEISLFAANSFSRYIRSGICMTLAAVTSYWISEVPGCIQKWGENGKIFFF